MVEFQALAAVQPVLVGMYFVGLNCKQPLTPRASPPIHRRFKQARVVHPILAALNTTEQPPMKLPTIRAARAYATALLARYQLPTAPLDIQKANGCYAIKSPACRLIVGSDGRVLYLRGKA